MADDDKSLFSFIPAKYRKPLAAVLALALILLTGGKILMSPNTGDEVEVVVEAPEVPTTPDVVPAVDDDDSAPAE